MSKYSPRPKALILLEDGTVFFGKSIGIQGTATGEVCFNTGMTGYQEIFTDPSYYGQLMMMTYPHIGNYGTMARDDEHRKVMVAGIITRAFSHEYSNPQADRSLQQYLEDHKVGGISGVDTRALVRHIREKGVMNAVISSEELDPEVLVKMAKDWDPMEGLELATRVSRSEAQTFHPKGESSFRIAAFDYGIKRNIINSFVARANGPGDPNPTGEYALEIVEYAKKSGKPLFGICLGHQLMALSEGIEVGKMFVGHRGANHPVKNLKTGLVEISTQNHGFAVKEDSVSEEVAEITHINLNDRTVEGLAFKRFPGFSVQYHPEASPGPHDSAYLFDQFIELMAEHKS